MYIDIIGRGYYASWSIWADVGKYGDDDDDDDHDDDDDDPLLTLPL